MSNIVEFILRLKDQMSGGMQAAVATAQRAMASTQNAAQKAQKAISGTASGSQRSLATLERALQRLEYRRRISIDQRDILRTSASIREIESRISRIQNGGRSSAGMSPLKGIAIGAALTAGAGSILSAGMQGQQQKASFEVMAGQQAGSKLYADLNKFAQDSIFGTEVFQAAQTMKAFGMQTEKVMPTLKMLGDISMGDKEKLSSLTLAFSQIQSAGRLTGQDLLQLVNAGFNPLQVISQQTGQSMALLKKQMESGAISAGMVEAAFKAATGPGGQFFDMTNKIAQTDFGKLEALKGQVEGLALKIGGTLAPIVGDLIQNYLVPFLNWLDATINWVKANSQWLTPLAIGIGAFAAGYRAVTLATTAWTAAQTILNVVLTANPIGLIIGAIAALIALIGYLVSKVDGWGKAWGHVVNGAKLLWQGFVSHAKLNWDTLINGIMIGLDYIKKGWYEFKNSVGLGDTSENNAAIQRIKSDIESRKKAIVDGVKSTASLYQKSAAEFAAAGNSLSWNNKQTISGTRGATQTGTTSAVSSMMGGSGPIGSDGVTNRGSKSLVVNVNKEMIGKIEFVSQNGRESGAQLESIVREVLFRVLYSLEGS